MQQWGKILKKDMSPLQRSPKQSSPALNNLLTDYLYGDGRLINKREQLLVQYFTYYLSNACYIGTLIKH
jgi:hypothetical protein